MNRRLHGLRAFFRYLAREGVLPRNPAADVESLKTPRRLPSYLTVPEQERVLAVMREARSLIGRRDYALVATALFCGLRVAELCHLRPEHVDLEAAILRVAHGKGDKEREISLITRLRAILEEYITEVRPKLLARRMGYLYRARAGQTWRAQFWSGGRQIDRNTRLCDRAEAERWLAEHVPPPVSPWFFVNAAPTNGYRLTRAGKPLLTRSVYARVRRVVAPIVGRPLSPHTLRHSFASRLREHEAPLELIGEALGHASLRTTMIYAHLSTKKRRQDLERYLTGEERSM